MEQTPAHDLPNPDLLAVMPEAARVVEVGCSRGALAKAYKQRHPSSHILGIEIDPTFAAAARSHCDEVLTGNIEELFRNGALSDLVPAQCWVFGDTLEHLQDPWQVLRFVKTLLSPNGCVCACIPNMQHWSIQLRLNTGKLEYADSGLLDRTHLRWFTRYTMVQLFESCGFQIASLQPRIFPHPHTQQASAVIGQIASQIGHNPQQAIQDALPLQYVIKAQPASTSHATVAPP
jgi:trans-aconitate methyltransferase